MTEGAKSKGGTGSTCTKDQGLRAAWAVPGEAKLGPLTVNRGLRQGFVDAGAAVESSNLGQPLTLGRHPFVEAGSE